MLTACPDPTTPEPAPGVWPFNPNDITNFHSAARAIAWLAKYFGLPQPSVVRTDRKVCFATESRWQIALGDRGAAHQGWRDVTLHEFAHLLHYHRHRNTVGFVKYKAHGVAFYECLKDVLRVTGLPYRDYGWAKEYWTLWHLATREGWTTETWYKARKREAAGATVAPVRVTGDKVAFVRVGEKVEWDSPRLQRTLTGRVLSAYAGCRAKVQAANGEQYYVPQGWLRPAKA
ncbi:MAG: hypothetical protein AB7K63_17300 [Vicinamibacterales bacterium]